MPNHANTSVTNKDGYIQRYVQITDEDREELYILDRLTDTQVIVYDLGDPADWDPRYGGVPILERAEEMGYSKHEEILYSQAESEVCISAIGHWKIKKEIYERQNKLEEETLDLEKFLPDIWDKFSFDRYHEGEQGIIKPALEKMGFKNIRFSMGEQDSFGPLSRIVVAFNTKTQKLQQFIYG